MSRKAICAIMIALIAVCLVGCGTKNDTKNDTEVEEPKGPSTTQADLDTFYELKSGEVMLMVNARLSEAKG